MFKFSSKSLIIIYYISYFFITYGVNFTVFLLTHSKLKISMLNVIVLSPLLITILIISYNKNLALNVKYFKFLSILILYSLYNIISFSIISIFYTNNSIMNILLNDFNVAFYQFAALIIAVYFYHLVQNNTNSVSILLKVYSRVFKLIAVITSLIMVVENFIYYFLNNHFFEVIEKIYTVVILSNYFGVKILRTFVVYFSALDFGMIMLLIFIFFDINKQLKNSNIFKMIAIIGVISSFTKILYLLLFIYLLFKKLKLLKFNSFILTHTILLLIIPYSIFKLLNLILNNYVSEVGYGLISSTLTRFSSWISIFKYCYSHISIINFLFGYGISQAGSGDLYKNIFYAIDNTYIAIFLNSGLIGILFTLFLYFIILKKLINIYNNSYSIELVRLSKFLILSWSIIPYFAVFNIIYSNYFFITIYTINITVIGIYTNRKISQGE